MNPCRSVIALAVLYAAFAAVVARAESAELPPEIAAVLKAAREINPGGEEVKQELHWWAYTYSQQHMLYGAGRIRWTTQASPAYFHDERISMTHSLSLDRGGKVTVLDKTLRAELILWKDDQRFVKPIALDHTEFRVSENDREPGEWLAMFRSSISTYFGQLAPGRYRTQLRVRGDGLQLEGGELLNDDWLSSPTMVFDVVQLEGREMKREKPAEIRIEILGREREQGRIRAVLVNDSKRTIEVAGYSSDITYGPNDVAPASCDVALYRPHRAWEWEDSGHYCGTGRIYTRIEPGVRQPVALYNPLDYEFAGVQQIGIPFSTVNATDETKDEYGTAVTPPFRLHGNRIAIFE